MASLLDRDRYGSGDTDLGEYTAPIRITRFGLHASDDALLKERTSS